jgi:hypothetical protein
MNRGLAGIAPWGAVLIAFIGAIYSYGTQSARIDSLESQVKEMRTDANANTMRLMQIQLDLAEVRTKLNILVPTPAPAKESGR